MNTRQISKQQQVLRVYCSEGVRMSHHSFVQCIYCFASRVHAVIYTPPSTVTGLIINVIIKIENRLFAGMRPPGGRVTSKVQLS